ncbi:MAG: lytic transglycosylase domain-containing protein, partial [Gammaproteobacteria bacterium]|nr:lytic transglycosylase domain-containing protein [Gammaproteobacteria bacterium]
APLHVDEVGFQLIGFSIVRDWQEVAARPENQKYVAALHAAEDANAIPRGLLVRLAYQESRFRADIISGAVRSSAGALGIMQIVPRWHPGVDPLDPFASITYAAGYLARLKRKFDTWERALQAYNWGEGNLSRWLAGDIQTMPSETRNYSAQILADLGTGGVYV